MTSGRFGVAEIAGTAASLRALLDVLDSDAVTASSAERAYIAGAVDVLDALRSPLTVEAPDTS